LKFKNISRTFLVISNFKNIFFSSRTFQELQERVATLQRYKLQNYGTWSLTIEKKMIYQKLAAVSSEMTVSKLKDAKN